MREFNGLVLLLAICKKKSQHSCCIITVCFSHCTHTNRFLLDVVGFKSGDVVY